MSGFTFENSKIISFGEKIPEQINFSIAISFEPQQQFPEHLNLHPLPSDSSKGPNLVRLLIDIRNRLMTDFAEGFNSLLQPEDGNPEIRYDRKIIMNFIDYPYRYFKYDSVYITFDAISFNLLLSITQNKFNWDRAGSVDFALIVENYITTQRNFASKRKDENKVTLSDPIQNEEEKSKKDILQNGNIIKVTLEYYVALDQRPDIVPLHWPELTVKIQAPPEEGPLMP